MPYWSTYWVDTKLGLRMLRKHWALTLIGGVAMTAAITLGASVFNFVQGISGTKLPLEEGERVVILQPWNTGSRTGRRASMDDFERWRRELQSLVDTGAFRRTERNLTTDAGPAGPLTVAEMSAAGFRVARVAPRLGRFFIEDDEQAGAPPVVVIGYNVWRSRFAADPEVIGRRVQLDGTFHTVTGVMPPGFAFPVNDQYWTPVRATDREEVTVFARLASGATLERAQAEVEALGLLPSAAIGAPPGPQKPRVVPYITGISGERNLGLLRIVPLLFALLLVPPCVNIAVLIYARTVARQGEFAARTALGASRSRIVAQIFIEVLLLAAAAAGAALVLAPRVTETLSYMVLFGNRGFWIDFGLSYRTILFASALALLAALIAGAIPALRATRRWQLAGGLHALNRGYAPRLGKAWTAIVVAQVALSVAVMPTSVEFAWDSLRPAILGPGFEADEFLAAQLAMDAREAPAAAAARFSVLRAEVVRQLKAEPGISAVTMFEFEPFAERNVDVEVDLAGPGSSVVQDRKSVNFNQVDSAFFEAFGLPLLAGRGFEPGDPQRSAVVVNRSFVNRVLPGGNPLGRRVRVVNRNGPAAAYEIVGLVGDQFSQSEQPTMYRPLAPVAAVPEAGAVLSVRFAMHTGSPIPSGLENRLRQITAALDPALRVDDLQTLGEIYWYMSVPEYIGGSGMVALALGIVLFSVAGIYTLMAFTVVQRRREIGIRSALGASPQRLVLGIFRRVLLPVSAGVALGGLAALLLDFYLSPLLFVQEGGRPLPWILPAAEAFILLVGVIAVFGPTRRALGVDPVEALRES
jgi:putative ABC transport system permease protein